MLNFVPTAVLFLAEACCLVAMAKMSRAEVPWLPLIYVYLLASFSALAAVGLTDEPFIDTEDYYDLFRVLLVGTLTLAAILSFFYTLIHRKPLAYTLVVAALFLGFAVALAARDWLARPYPQGLPPQYNPILAQGGLGLAMGILALASLMAPHSPTGFALRLAFGVYWLGLGVIAFVLAFSAANNVKYWRTFNIYVPALYGAMIFVALTAFLSLRQREFTRQPVAAHIEMEQAQ